MDQIYQIWGDVVESERPFLNEDMNVNVRSDIMWIKINHSTAEINQISINIRKHTETHKPNQNELKVKIDNISEDVVQSNINVMWNNNLSGNKMQNLSET